MTDKVQKIREKVENRYEYWKERESNSHSIESEIRMSECQHLLLMLDSMQEEPKFKTGDRIKPIDSCLGSPRTIVDICDSWYITDQGTLDFEYEDNWELVEEPASEDLKEFEVKYIEREKDNIVSVYDRHAGLVDGAQWQKEQMMKDTADAVIGLPYENKDGGYTHLIDVSRPLPVGNNKIAIIFKEK